jgi:hypothetical protein
VLRAAAHSIGRRVKLADLHDNCDLTRIAWPTARDQERIARYRRAIATIEALNESPRRTRVNGVGQIHPLASFGNLSERNARLRPCLKHSKERMSYDLI